MKSEIQNSFSNERKHLVLYSCILGILLGLFSSSVHVSVDAGLAISSQADYPQNSVMRDYFLGSWTILNQISALLLEVGFSYKSSSIVISCVHNVVTLVAYSLIIYAFSRHMLLSIIFSLVLFTFHPIASLLSSPTYYLAISKGIHTYGIFSLILPFLFLSLIINRLFGLAGFFVGLTVSVHVVTGVYLLGVITVMLVMPEKIISKLPKLNLIKGLFVGLLVSLASLGLYLAMKPDFSPVDPKILEDYFKFWDSHRNREFDLFKVILIVTCNPIILALLFKFFSEHKNIQLTIVVMAIVFVSTVSMYIFSHFVILGELSNIFKKANAGRFLNIPAVMSGPFLVCIAYAFIYKHQSIMFQKLRAVKKGVYVTILFIAFGTALLHTNKNYKKISCKIKETNKCLKKIEDFTFWHEIKNQKISGQILAQHTAAYKALRLGSKPVLLADIDFIPYLPSTATKVSNIINEVYEVDFSNPPKTLKPRGIPPDELAKLKWQSRSIEKWVSLGQKFNFSAIIIPNDWSLSMEPKIRGKKYSYYLIPPLN